MRPALSVARYLILLASAESEPEFLSQMRLQKLLYYVQGWSLASRQSPMFSGRLEAWVHGPATYNVYRAFRAYDKRPIPHSEGSEAPLHKNERAFIASIWEHYKAFSASELRRMTHSEPPWLKARGDLPADQPSRVEITVDSMMSWFSSERRRFETPGLGLGSVTRARTDIRAGRGVPLSALLEKYSNELQVSAGARGGRENRRACA